MCALLINTVEKLHLRSIYHPTTPEMEFLMTLLMPCTDIVKAVNLYQDIHYKCYRVLDMPLKLVTMKGLKMDNCKVMSTTRKASKTIFLGVWVFLREAILVGAFSVGSFFQGTFFRTPQQKIYYVKRFCKMKM